MKILVNSKNNREKKINDLLEKLDEYNLLLKDDPNNMEYIYNMMSICSSMKKLKDHDLFESLDEYSDDFVVDEYTEHLLRMEESDK